MSARYDAEDAAGPVAADVKASRPVRDRLGWPAAVLAIGALSVGLWVAVAGFLRWALA